MRLSMRARLLRLSKPPADGNCRMSLNGTKRQIGAIADFVTLQTEPTSPDLAENGGHEPFRLARSGICRGCNPISSDRKLLGWLA